MGWTDRTDRDTAWLLQHSIADLDARRQNAQSRADTYFDELQTERLAHVQTKQALVLATEDIVTGIRAR